MPGPVATERCPELSGARASVRDRARSPARTRSPAVLRRAGHPPAGRHVRRAGSRDHRRLRRARHHHRGRGGQGARRRAGRRAGDPRRPGYRHPAAGRRPHRHHHRPRDRCAAAAAGAAVCPRVPHRWRPRGPQRALRRRLPARRLQAPRRHLAAPARAVHRPARPRRADPGRGTQRPAGRARRAVRHHHPAHAPRARGRAGHGRGAPPPARTDRQPGCAEPRGAAHAGPRRHAAPADGAPAAQPPPRGVGAGRAGGLPVPRCPRRGPLRRHQRRPAAPGAQLLHRGRAPAGASATWWRRPSGWTRSSARTPSRRPCTSCG